MPLWSGKVSLSFLNHEGVCKRVADKYIEHENFLVLLDVVLQKIPAYRHVVFNSEFKAFWKLGIICLLSDAYSKWTQGRGPNADAFIFELDWSFYFKCLIAAAELGSYILTVLIHSYVLTLIRRSTFPTLDFKRLIDGLLFAHFGQLFTIPAVIWSQSTNPICNWLIFAFVAFSNIQAYRAVTLATRLNAQAAVTLGIGCRFLLSNALNSHVANYEVVLL